jgi:predicted metal-binding membrane protein
MTEWREGAGGAWAMGLKHGVYCVTCCWLIMALLFVLGVMNLIWIAALSFFVLIEKIVPNGLWIGRVSGIVFIVWGVLLLATM